MQILLGLDILSLSGLAMICTDYEALMYLTVYNFDSTLYYFVEPFVCAKIIDKIDSTILSISTCQNVARKLLMKLTLENVNFINQYAEMFVKLITD